MKQLVFLTTLVIAVSIVSCGKKEEKEPPIIRPIKAIQITDLRDYELKDFPGVAQEKSEVTISFRIPGTLEYLNAEVGQKIMAGNQIAGIDPRDYEVDRQAKEARYIQAKSEKERYESLHEKGSVSKNDLDMKVAAFLEASSAFEQAKNNLTDTKIYAPFTGFVGSKYVENYRRSTSKTSTDHTDRSFRDGDRFNHS